MSGRWNPLYRVGMPGVLFQVVHRRDGNDSSQVFNRLGVYGNPLWESTSFSQPTFDPIQDEGSFIGVENEEPCGW